ncbi:hypothetical protein ACCO45_005687 [Purpureocillium lilacinum]|uniref:Uncharacterized protein n=1 Tax=Purpureocillium lilacinum TaxID=33203 RepID=A0ACC4DW51_PURLI
MASSTGTTSLSEIPTVAQLYESSALRPSPRPLAHPSAAANAGVGLIRGDITKLQLDAIVNAANESLLGGGGVDGAIHRAAGKGLLAECKGLGGCPTGQARITRGTISLPSVSSTLSAPCTTVETLRRASDFSEESLKLAVVSGVKTLAFSGISTGVYGYPSLEAAHVACETVRNFLDRDSNSIERVVFVTFEAKDVAAYNEVLPEYFPEA